MIDSVLNIEGVCLLNRAPEDYGAGSGSECADKLQLPSINTFISGNDLEMPNIKIQSLGKPKKLSCNRAREYKRSMLSEKQKSILLNWLQSHLRNPYPSSIEKDAMAQSTGLTREQINTWFTNNRVRRGMSLSGSYTRPKGSSMAAPKEQ